MGRYVNYSASRLQEGEEFAGEEEPSESDKRDYSFLY